MADGPGWEKPGWAPLEVDPTRPGVARVYDFSLGGSHNVAPDAATYPGFAGVGRRA